MWAEQVLLGVIGLASGAVIAGGLFSHRASVLSPSLRTGPTREDRFYCMKILLYWEGPLFNIFYLYQVRIPGGSVLLAVLGIFRDICRVLGDGAGRYPQCISDLYPAAENCKNYTILSWACSGENGGSAFVFPGKMGNVRRNQFEKADQQRTGKKAKKLRRICVKTENAGAQCLEKYVPGLCNRRCHLSCGQIISNYVSGTGMDKEMTSCYTSMLLVFLSVLLTGLGLYPKIAKWGGAGALVPITGFANSVAAPAIEYKKEGQVFGIGCKIFTIAGPVILYGIVTSWAFGLIYYLLLKAGINW